MARPRIFQALTCAGAGLLGACGSSTGGNGISGDTASQAVVAMNAAVKQAISVHMSGSIESGGSTLTLDISVQLPGRLTGKVATSSQGSFTVETTDDTTISLTPDASFWTVVTGGKDVSSLTGKCLTVTGSDTEFADLPKELKQLIDISSLAQANNDATGVSKAGQSIIDGVAVQEFIATDKSEVYIATSGQPLPIELVQPGTGTLHLTQWNQTVSVTLPHGCLDTTQLARLLGGSGS